MKHDIEINKASRLIQVFIGGFLFGGLTAISAWIVLDIKRTSDPKAHNDIRLDKTVESCKAQGGLNTIIFVEHDRDDRKTSLCCPNSYSSSKKKCFD